MEFLTLEESPNQLKIRAVGSWNLEQIKRLKATLLSFVQTVNRKRETIFIDFTSVEEFDTAGMILLLELREALLAKRFEVELKLTPKQQKMLSLIKIDTTSQNNIKKRGFFYRFGRGGVEFFISLAEIFEFVGRFFVALLRMLAHPYFFRPKETFYHIQKSGIDALFIIVLTSILVGLVVAYQSIVQLSQFGADIFVVDAIGISITRELGPMITAIVIAGRSASSYTAEIGSMKITEEINAMKTMGFDPFYFLVIPRVVALVISLPLAIFLADIAGILGGMIATNLEGGVSFYFFMDRLHEVLDVSHYILGIIKGPFFAILIALTGTFHGFRVTNDTESIGIETTASVVHAIFLVIVCDAIFSIIYTELGL
jgi:phospholipid/cholesterol/gamma-HCH transport system permease protein